MRSPVRRAGLRGLLPKLALSAGTLLLTYLFCEFLAFPLAVAWFPHKARWRLDGPIELFAQTTKSGRAPKDYVLLLGDSYSRGLGSEWESLGHWTRRPFGSQAALHARTGRDILTLGHAGAGSLGALVADPVGQFAFLDRTWLFKLERPKVVLAYFYEGNDLDDNVRDLRRRYDGAYDADRLRDPEAFQAFIRKAVLEQDLTYMRARQWSPAENLFFGKFCRESLKIFRKLLPGFVPAAEAAEARGASVPGSAGRSPSGRSHPEGTAPADPVVNLARVAGRQQPLPGALQGPALELTDDELARGVRVFEHSLAFLKEFFPKARVVVVYIPSPLASYDLAWRWVWAETYHDRHPFHESEKVRRRSDRIAGMIRKAAAEAGCGFVDARPVIRARAKEELLHGPDWKHLNKRGYAVLAEAVLPALEDSAP